MPESGKLDTDGGDVVSLLTAPKHPVEADTIATFRTSGWVLCEEYVPKNVIEALGREADALSQNPGAVAECQYYMDRFTTGETRLARVERITERLPTLHGSGLAARMVRDAEAVLEGPVVAFKDKLNIRYPGSAGYAPHQDAARWHRFADRFVSFGVFLSASDAGHGGFSFARYDLSQGLKPTASGDFDAVDFASLPRQEIAGEAGDTLIIDGAAPHSTTENRSGARVLHLLFTFAKGTDANLRDEYYAAQEAAFERVRHGNVFTFAARD